MKTTLLVALLFTQTLFAAASFYTFSPTGIDDKKRPLSEFAGKVALVVNTASQCGFTPQYKDLEALYQKYRKQGFVVLGFPSDDFGSQEPGSNAQIKKFCESKFKVTFPLFSKAHVKGPDMQPTYRFLVDTAQPKDEVSWNFEKFLIDKNGHIAARFKSSVNPNAPELEKAIEAELKK